MSFHRAVITGYGVVSPIGYSVSDMMAGLDAGVGRVQRALRAQVAVGVAARRERLRDALAFDGDFSAAGFVEARPET